MAKRNDCCVGSDNAEASTEMEPLGTSFLRLERDPATGQLSIGFELNPEMACAADQWRDYYAALGRPLSSTMQSMQDAASSFRSRFPKVREELTKRVWFVSAAMSVSALRECEAAISAGDFNLLDNVMSVFTDGRIETVCKAAVHYFPDRARPFESAFAAHRRADYWSSVPLLLCQADGISQHMLTAQLYSQRPQNRERLHQTLSTENETEDTLSVLLHALRIKGPLNARETDMTQYPGMLNRHSVLHGSCTTFGTRLNSLKLISLLDFLLTVVWQQARRRCML